MAAKTVRLMVVSTVETMVALKAGQWAKMMAG